MPKLLAAALAIEAVVVGALLTVALDMYAHHRVETLGGVNIWGYRGPVMHVRGQDEIRIVVVGGDLAFGWGVAASETLTPTIRQLVALATDQPGKVLRPVTAVNLGAMGLPPAGYASRLEHFGYLKPDIVCIVADAHRATWGRAWLPDTRSAVWQQTGYAPMLPLVLEEKGWRRTSAALGWLDAAPGPTQSAGVNDYGGGLAAAVRQALDLDAAVVLVLPPQISENDRPDHAAVADAITERFGAEPGFRLLDLAQEIGKIDDGLLLDGINLSTGGHLKVAMQVAPAVVDLALRRSSS